jgi:hypothetical protein
MAGELVPVTQQQENKSKKLFFVQLNTKATSDSSREFKQFLCYSKTAEPQRYSIPQINKMIIEFHTKIGYSSYLGFCTRCVRRRTANRSSLAWKK